jgi:alanyl-tRNA synthetase
VDRARQLVERVKRLESEAGKLRKGDVAAQAETIAGRADVRSGVRFVAVVVDGEAGELRELAQQAVQRLEGPDGAAVVLGSGAGGKGLLIAASSRRLVERGVSAPALLEEAARMIGGGAGGKPGLAIAGGPNGAAVVAAVDGIPNRLEALLAGV